MITPAYDAINYLSHNNQNAEMSNVFLYLMLIGYVKELGDLRNIVTSAK